MEWGSFIGSSSTIATISLWIVNTLYTAGIIPQIILNYKQKSAEGISDIMVFGYMAGYLAQLIYIFALHLPLAYKVMVPVGIFFIFIIIVQRFYYAPVFPKSLFYGYVLLAVFIAATIPCAVEFPHNTGHIVGWISVVIWTLYQIPQGIKMFLEKTTHGFSFWFATIMAAGVLVELISAVVLRLPLQTILVAGRGLIGYVIFCIEFVMYRK